jgi:hypothetical protein
MPTAHGVFTNSLGGARNKAKTTHPRKVVWRTHFAGSMDVAEPRHL